MALLIFDGRNLTQNTVVNADICIIGGGVAGLVIAKELSKSNKNIVLIESGDEGFSMENQSLYAPDQKNDTLYPDPTYTRLRFLGGASNHWENNTSPLDKIDFEKKEWIKNSGWPIKYDDIKNYYSLAAKYCGVNDGNYNVDKWANKLDAPDLVRASDILDTGIAKASIPPTRFFAVHGEDIVSAKSVRIFKNSNVTDIEYDNISQKVKKIFFETSPGTRHEVNAKIFVMCCGGIENARLMLHFNQKYKNKLGNTHDNVGRYFMDHPMVRGAHFYPHKKLNLKLYKGAKLNDNLVLGYFKLSDNALHTHQVSNARMPIVLASNYTISDGISSHHIMMDSFNKGEIPDDFGTHLLNFINDIDMVAEAVSRKAFDTKLFDYADEKTVYQIPMMVEQTPNRNNRIKLGKNKDVYGIPKIDIEWEVTNEDKERAYKTLNIFANEIGALGLGRIRVLQERDERIWGDQLGFGHHHMGTTRMGFNEREGVVDSNLKVFGTNNLFVSGSSVFPTGGHVPPTLTIVSLSIRLARYLSGSTQDDQ